MIVIFYILDYVNHILKNSANLGLKLVALKGAINPNFLNLTIN